MNKEKNKQLAVMLNSIPMTDWVEKTKNRPDVTDLFAYRNGVEVNLRYRKYPGTRIYIIQLDGQEMYYRETEFWNSQNEIDIIIEKIFLHYEKFRDTKDIEKINKISMI